MSIRTKNIAIGSSVALLLLAGITVGTAISQEIKIVIPPDWETFEGDAASCVFVESCVGVGYRAQSVYPAAEFGSLPQDLVITGWYWRPDHTATPRSGGIDDYLVRLSTTDKGPRELDHLFVNNVGEDVVTVYEGPLSLVTQATDTDAGPKEFDYHVPFQTPFPYDPTTGQNLLVDVTTASGISFVQLADAITSNPPRVVFSYDAPTAASGDLFNISPVVQFVFAPSGDIDLDGDYNSNGAVEQADLDLVLLNWGTETPPIPEGWTGVPPEGLIEQNELDDVLLNWGNTSTSANSVPEPTSVMLALVGVGIACLRGRRMTG